MSNPREVADSVTRILEDTARPREAPRPIRFGDSIAENLESLREVLSQLPRPSKRRARAASIAIEDMITRLQRESSDGATALGVLLAASVICERLIGAQRDAGLIQLAS